jgi:hypothetical protein
MELVNRVAQSGLVTIDLEQYLPEGEIVGFDLKEYLFMGMILKEKDFREALKKDCRARYGAVGSSWVYAPASWVKPCKPHLSSCNLLIHQGVFSALP